ncbi:hypothetical protein SAY87_009263 [Trapa incisa]|uniref:Gnk2-homologous domain-containing protein n=1 Tax=Trapa incisa TaxID=236973 RepID=A0AAN7PX89_9MYRT|nr:hypothetical protein SAY87_009263 [Trapa incisa]
MKTYVKSSFHASQLIFLITLGFNLPFIEPNTDYSTLVYKNCANETFSDESAAASSYQKTLDSMFNQLLSHSSQSKFFRITAGNTHGRISGLYQCREDITNQDCHVCVTKLPYISSTLCNRAKAAEIQLSGCSLRYKINSLSLQTKDQLPAGTIKYDAERKDCSRERVDMDRFDELRDSAFVELESQVFVRHGRCTVQREMLRAMAQCEGVMGEQECIECVKHAASIAKEACERAVSGQVSLSRCSVSYLYGQGGWDGFAGGGYPYLGYHNGDDGYHDHSGRLGVILGGGAAAVLLGLLLLVLIWIARRKDG